MENVLDDAMRQQEEQKRMDDVRRVEAVMQMARQNQQNSWDEFSGVMQNVRSQRQQLQLAKQNDTASMMRCAMENGGAVPNEIVDLFNRKYFTPEQVQSGYGVQPGSGFMRDGSFNIRMGMGIDQNTNQPAVQDVSLDLPQQFVIMNRNSSVFDDGARQALSKKLLSLGYSGRELDNLATMGGGPEMAIYTPEGQKNAMSLGILRARAANPDAISTRIGGGAGGREIGGTAPFKRPFEEPHGVHVFASDGEGGITRSSWTQEGGLTEENLGTRDPNYQGQWNVIESNADGKRYVNDKTGEEQFVKDGDIPPWLKTVHDKTVEAALIRAASAREVQQMKGRQAIEQILASALGKQSLDAAQKYALYHFEDFSMPQEHEATKEDVDAGRAKKVGEKFYTLTTPDQAFNSAVDFYKRKILNQDPATNPGQGGQQPASGINAPIVISPFDPLHPNNSALNTPSAPAAGGEAAPVQTATPSPSATATPPAEGQGEFDFGGGEPEAAPAATQTTTQAAPSDEEEERKRRQAAKPKMSRYSSLGFKVK